MTLRIETATDADASELASLHRAVADDLTRRHGRGHWSHGATERGVLRAIKTSRVLVARSGSKIAGTLCLATKKPWAIDVGYFTPVRRALYLLDMAVALDARGGGVGRALIAAAVGVARDWPSQAVRLDAYDSAAGAGAFYARCGFREVGRVVYRGTPLVYFELLLPAT